MTKAVLIDLDDTLLDFTGSSQRSIRQEFDEFGLPFSDDVLQVFRRHNQSVWHRMELGELEIGEMRLLRWQLTFDECRLAGDPAAFEKRFEELLTKAHAVTQDAREAMRYLSAKYPVYAATNGFSAAQRSRLRMSGLLNYFSGLFISEEVGYSKPDGRFFDHCMAHLHGIGRDEVMMIGDSLTSDMRGAVDAGIPSCWLNRNKQSLPKELPVTCQITSLSEIPSII